jgi:hypothetical protein
MLRALASALLLLLASSACGSGDGNGGGAGTGPVVTPTLGDRCTNECTSGLVCSASGPFRGQCSAQCSGIDSCSMLAPGKTTACVGECALRCTADGECPTGTFCGTVAGQMACVTKP